MLFRRYRDTRSSWPHLANAGKYSSGMISNFISFLSHTFQVSALFYTWLASKVWRLKIEEIRKYQIFTFGFIASKKVANLNLSLTSEKGC